MGGSLARALSELPEAPTLVGWSPEPGERDAALAAGAVTRAPEEWRDAVAAADLVVLAAPLRASCELLGPVAAAAPPAATISDVASLKAPLAEAAEAAGVTDRWVGGHPMAGSEQSGFEASRPGLYRGALVWTASAAEAAPRVPAVHALWRSVGAVPVAIEPEAHDRLVAKASQLPQLTANALATVLAAAGVEPGQLGPGGKDMTRLAASGAAMWRDLLGDPSPDLIAGLRALSTELERFAGMLEERDLDALEQIMRTTREWRRG